ncbi:MAG: hypothetical protein ACLU3F_11555 [Blautia wexlerae]
MKANSGLKKNRTKIQMVLTALVILSVVRQFFLGNYHNMFLGILTLILFMVPQFLDRKLNVTIPPGLETVDSDLYLFSRNSWRNQCLLCKNPYLGYHFTYY